MNSKERRKERKRIARLEIAVIDEEGGHHFKSYTQKQMNDFCPNIYKCHKPYEFRCFGRYMLCPDYLGQNETDRNI